MNDEEETDLLDPFQLLGEFLREDGWEPQRVGDKPAYEFAYTAENGVMAVYAWIREGFEQLFIHVMLPFAAGEENRVAMGELLTRINHSLPIGNFEMNFDTGELRFKGSLDFRGTVLLPALIRNLLYQALETSNLYLPALRAVAEAGFPPVEALKALGDVRYTVE